MQSSERFLIDIADKELISLDLVEKEIITVEIHTIDTLTGLRKNISEFDDINISNPEDGEILVYENGEWINKTLTELIDTNTVHNEIPTPVSPVNEGDPYTTAYGFVAETLEIYLNGIRLTTSDFTILSNKTFSINITTLVSDIVSVDYMKS